MWWWPERRLDEGEPCLVLVLYSALLRSPFVQHGSLAPMSRCCDPSAAWAMAGCETGGLRISLNTRRQDITAVLLDIGRIEVKRGGVSSESPSRVQLLSPGTATDCVVGGLLVLGNPLPLRGMRAVSRALPGDLPVPRVHLTHPGLKCCLNTDEV